MFITIIVKWKMFDLGLWKINKTPNTCNKRKKIEYLLKIVHS